MNGNYAQERLPSLPGLNNEEMASVIAGILESHNHKWKAEMSGKKKVTIFLVVDII